MYYCMNNLKKGQNTAGIKAPKDVFEICSDCGFQEIKFFEPEKHKSVFLTRIGAVPTGIRNWMRLQNSTKSGDWVLIQHPNENIVVGNYYIKRLKKKGIHFIALIHDLETLRKSLSDIDAGLEKRNSTADNSILSMCDYIICHNSSMKQYLVQKGFEETKIFELGIFDYLYSNDVKTVRVKNSPVVIAGNLQKGKCDYLYKLMDFDSIPFAINLYGPNYSGGDKKNIHYFGSFPPDDLPGKLEGSFGLVWDGTEIDRCAGNAGEYIKYNNPHKCSLFLASGLPVIIWKQAALASFIEENHLGITIDSLLEIQDRIDAITDSEYEQIVNNTKNISLKLRQGYYLRSVLKEMGIVQ